MENALNPNLVIADAVEYVVTIYHCKFCVERFDTIDKVRCHYLKCHSEQHLNQVIDGGEVEVDDQVDDEVVDGQVDDDIDNRDSMSSPNDNSDTLPSVGKKIEAKKRCNKRCRKKRLRKYKCRLDACSLMAKLRSPPAEDHLAKKTTGQLCCNFTDARSGLKCQKKFEDSDLFTAHQQNHDNPRPWFCDWPDCDYRALQRNHLIGHVRKSHTGRYQFKCDWPGCNFRGPSRYNVKRHRIIHTGEKPYKCDWPGCDFESPNNKLTAHKRIHTGERPFPCDWPGCEARFSRPFTLRNHKRTHTGEKPFICDWPGCDYRSAQQTPLVTHKRKHQHVTGAGSVDVSVNEVVLTLETNDLQFQ